MLALNEAVDFLHPKKKNFFNSYSRIAPITLFLIRAKECELLSNYVYRRPVLDIGCGEGIFSKHLFDGQVDVGYDMSLKDVQQAKKLGAYKEVFCGKAEKMPFAASSFNSIICNCVLEHVQDIDMVFNEIYRVLIPGARAYLTVATPLFSHAHSLDDVLHNKFGIKLTLGTRIIDKLYNHNNNLDAGQWSKKINKAGLKILETRPYLSAHLLNIMGFFLPFSIVSLLWKKTLNRWRLFPEFRRPEIITKLIKRCYDKEATKNGCLFFIVTKEKE